MVALPTACSHEQVDETVIKQGKLWKKKWGGGVPLLVRWTTDFDCPKKQNGGIVLKIHHLIV